MEPPRDPAPSPESAGSAAGHGHPTSRRQLITWLSQAFLGLWGFGAAAAIASYLRAPERGASAAERVVRVGPLEELAIGHGRLVRHGTKPFYVVRLDAARVIALSAICTHVRCILGFDRDRRALVCPCHDGRFDLAGNVISGPPPRALQSYAVSVRAGEVFVHL